MMKMVIEDGKIIECTRMELYDYWLKRYTDIYSFTEYYRKVTEAGTIVTDPVDEKLNS